MTTFRRLRLARDLTLEQLAAALACGFGHQVSKSTISRWETSGGMPDGFLLPALDLLSPSTEEREAILREHVGSVLFDAITGPDADVAA